MFTSQQLIGDIEASTGGVLWNNILKAFAKLTGKHLSLFVFLQKWQTWGFLLFSCYSFLRKIFMIIIFDIWLNYFYAFECILRIFFINICIWNPSVLTPILLKTLVYPANFNLRCLDRNPSLFMNIENASRVFQEPYSFLAWEDF